MLTCNVEVRTYSSEELHSSSSSRVVSSLFHVILVCTLYYRLEITAAFMTALVSRIQLYVRLDYFPMIYVSVFKPVHNSLLKAVSALHCLGLSGIGKILFIPWTCTIVILTKQLNNYFIYLKHCKAVVKAGGACFLFSLTKIILSLLSSMVLHYTSTFMHVLSESLSSYWGG